jgi:hypothetical protein
MVGGQAGKPYAGNGRLQDQLGWGWRIVGLTPQTRAIMDKRRCLKIALRINARLHSELGEGIDAQRMVTDPLYQRDVLLVCDALVGTEAHSLAGSFRRALALETPKPLLRAPLAISSLLNAIFGPAEPAEREEPAKPITRRPGAATRRPPPPGRPRRTAVRPPPRRAVR